MRQSGMLSAPAVPAAAGAVAGAAGGRGDGAATASTSGAAPLGGADAGAAAGAGAGGKAEPSGEVDVTHMTAKQRKLFELRLKLNEGRKARSPPFLSIFIHSLEADIAPIVSSAVALALASARPRLLSAPTFLDSLNSTHSKRTRLIPPDSLRPSAGKCGCGRR